MPDPGSPAVRAGEVPRFNRDTDKREMPMSYGFAHASVLQWLLVCSQARIGADQQSLPV